MRKISFQLAACGFCFAVLALAAGPAQAEISVIASAQSSLASLTPDQVEQAFSGKASAFADGRKTHLVDLPDANGTRDEFYAKALGKSAAQMKAYWSRLTFTGKGLPPTVVGDAAAVKKAVVADPDTLGYIDSSNVDGTVKVVAKVK